MNNIAILKYKDKILYILLMFIFLGCKSITAEYSDINNFQAIIQKENDKETLIISGLCMHSAYVINNIEYVIREEKLYITIFLTMTNQKGKSGSFNESFIIPQGVNIILFGKDEKEIWKRETANVFE